MNLVRWIEDCCAQAISNSNKVRIVLQQPLNRPLLVGTFLERIESISIVKPPGSQTTNSRSFQFARILPGRGCTNVAEVLNGNNCQESDRQQIGNEHIELQCDS